MRVSNLVTNERAQLVPFNSGNTTFTFQRGTNAAADFNRDGTTDFDFTPPVATTATVSSAIPIMVAGQKVFIAAPANPLAGLPIQRTGLLDSNDLPTPYSLQYNAGVQRQLGWNSVIDVNFIYTRTIREFMLDADVSNFFPAMGGSATNRRASRMGGYLRGYAHAVAPSSRHQPRRALSICRRIGRPHPRPSRIH